MSRSALLSQSSKPSSPNGNLLITMVRTVRIRDSKHIRPEFKRCWDNTTLNENLRKTSKDPRVCAFRMCGTLAGIDCHRTSIGVRAGTSSFECAVDGSTQFLFSWNGRLPVVLKRRSGWSTVNASDSEDSSTIELLYSRDCMCTVLAMLQKQI